MRNLSRSCHPQEEVTHRPRQPDCTLEDEEEAELQGSAATEAGARTSMMVGTVLWKSISEPSLQTHPTPVGSFAYA